MDMAEIGYKALAYAGTILAGPWYQIAKLTGDHHTMDRLRGVYDLTRVPELGSVYN